MPFLDDAEVSLPDYRSATQYSSSSLQTRAADFPDSMKYGSMTRMGFQLHTQPSYDRLLATAAQAGSSMLLRSSIQPQRMSDEAPQQAADEESGLIDTKRNSRRKGLLSSLCGCSTISTCNILVIITIIILILIILVAGASIDSNEIHRSGNHDGYQSPISLPPAATQPEIGDLGLPSSCLFDYYSNGLELEFRDVQNFDFLELMQASTYFTGAIDGQITVRPATSLQDADIKLWVSYATTRSFHVKSSNFNKRDDAFVLNLPHLEQTGPTSTDRPCLGVSVRIEVKPGVTLANWQLSTSNLNIKVEDGLFDRNAGEHELSTLQITNSSLFDALRGDVSIAYWASRETKIDLSSGSIRGRFALLDLLSVKSQSGSIDISVDPKESDPSSPKPATFHATTSSGSIKARFPLQGVLPTRSYITHIETSSGAISGTYILGAKTTVHSTSATIKSTLLPIFDSYDLSELYMHSQSGSQSLTLLPPYAFPGESFSALPSEHKFETTSGTLNLRYPEEWAGHIEGETMSGSIDVKGKGVKAVVNEKFRSWYRHFVARKGEGKGKLQFKTTSGDVKLRIGDE